MDRAAFVYTLIESIIFLATLGSFVWKFSSKITSVEKDVDTLKYNDIKQDNQYATILSSINNIECSIVRLETKLEQVDK